TLIERRNVLADVQRCESLALIPLVALVFAVGLFPKPFLERITPAVDGLVNEYIAKRDTLAQDDSLRLLGEKPTAAQAAIPRNSVKSGSIHTPPWTWSWTTLPSRKPSAVTSKIASTSTTTTTTTSTKGSAVHRIFGSAPAA